MAVARTAKYTRNETSMRDKTLDSYEIQNQSIGRPKIKMISFIMQIQEGQRSVSYTHEKLIGAILTNPFILEIETLDTTTPVSCAQFDSKTGTAKLTFTQPVTGRINIMGYAALSKDAIL